MTRITNHDVFPGPSSIEIVDESHGVRAELDPQTLSALTAVAVRNEVSYIDVLQMCIMNESFLLEQEAAGSRLILQCGKNFNILERRAA